MEKQTKNILKAIVEQNIIQSDYPRERKDWVTVYKAIDATDVDFQPVKRLSKIVILGYFGSILVAGILSVYLFTHLPSVTN
jgi:hypothetical protein